jgi:hypothetical protein
MDSRKDREDKSFLATICAAEQRAFNVGWWQGFILASLACFLGIILDTIFF